MSVFTKKLKRGEDDPDLNMIPIMNIFLVIIPFLLTSVSFYHIKAINTSVPVLAGGGQELNSRENVKLTIILEMQPAELRLSATADELSPEELQQYDRLIKQTTAGIYPLKQLNEYLQSIKKSYPASDTLILIPDDSVIYESIIQAMDAARKVDEQQLFPNVVLSGSLG
ncbi:MAG: biopolymer transporter ExbD [Deltaproteobacteria bacterium]|nr:biopolymer transporter ExbD [Deltaproteobacteria bacterium]